MSHLGDTNKMVSDTPRTDSHNWHDGDYDDPLHAFADFAKQLERELNAANERIKRLEDRIHRVSNVFFADASDKHASVQMLQILEEERGKK